MLALSLTKIVKLCTFLVMVQYYRDIWARLSKIVSPLTNLVGECRHTNITRAHNTKKKP